MVLFSADLTVIQDSIIKVGDKISRDFVELENLQNSIVIEDSADNTVTSDENELLENAITENELNAAENTVE